ncbi:XIAP-associated factor 1 [Brachyhypopomus gauderio]|uniref:XIAP-associated factor 1 n=1 Tax=Brachyhypopomus gauderio TaxID=698409 RepID=UPI004041D468
MADEDDVEQCRHCKKDVAKANLAMHEAHCQRFLCVCPVCDDLVPKEQLEEHRVEIHTTVKCKKCNMEMERQTLGDHETSECPERFGSCEFCELELPLSSLKEHTVTCGSRTERCSDCSQYVILKDRQHHAQICSSTLMEEHHNNKKEFLNDYMKAPPVNIQDFKFGDLHANTSSKPKSGQLSLPDPNLSFSALQKIKTNMSAGRGDADQIRPCPLCHLALPLRTLQWHENKCKIFESLKLMKSQK